MSGGYPNGPRGRSWKLRVLVCSVSLLLGAQTSWPLAVLYGSIMLTLLLAAERRMVR